jgi:predicted enzyme related to lactoylglutathione lyase
MKERQKMNLNYVILYVRDLDKAKVFYTEALGLTVLEAASGPTFVTLRSAGGAMLGLQDKTASRLPPAREEQPGSAELSFEVDDVDGTWQRWKEKNVEIVTDPMDLPFGRYFLAKDPEGHYLSAYRFTPPAITPPESARQGS